jgi:curved DNA-binding protein
MKYKDYYDILGVSRDADTNTIKSAYRKLARKYHPDVNKTKEAEEKFKDINEAYEVLSDKNKRQRYDSLGSNWQGGADYTPPPGFENFSFNFNQGGAQSFDFGGSGFSDFFSSLFGDMMGGMNTQQTSQNFRNFDFGSSQGTRSSRRTTRTEQPAELDITKNLNVTAKEVFEGKPITVTFTDMEKCRECSGGGYCSHCGGTGIVSTPKTVKVKLPKGIEEGKKIRLKGEGKSDRYGSKGDLYFVVHFKDSEYDFDGANITKDVEITPPEAVLGCTKDIQTLHGKINIKIPSGVSSGQSLRLKGLGLPITNGYGDLNARIKIIIPKNQSKEIVDLYKQILALQ